MCNAWNHHQDCDCGFGPPYRWEIKADPPKSWDEVSLLDAVTYERHLTDLGLSRIEIDEQLTRYGQHRLPMSEDTWDSLSSKDKDNWKTRILALFGRYKYKETTKYIDKKIDIPIFKLHSPNVRNSRVNISRVLVSNDFGIRNWKKSGVSPHEYSRVLIRGWRL